ncbi:DUF4178 domain-containing protein [Butyrivibrio sp. AC2005]|uniref:DUF4178 domain-containing protein n=1 Tax=Butyrivibrio sp. AC2005 TaxID=1280672 RepID=UPI0005D23A2D|nr:DUF4178 domain-containing protein [Butyrivibrio sp. AC2005]
MNIQVGSILMISNLEARVIGWIEYKNINDGGKRWREYRLKTKFGERWLSIDDVYKEYSLSWPDNSVRGRIGPEWHQVDKGRQVVTACGGDVDVEGGDAADFVEFEDASEDNILSVETWDDGTEFSKGVYLDLEDIRVVGYEKPKATVPSGLKGSLLSIGFTILIIVLGLLSELPAPAKKISKYLQSGNYYEYVTSITGNEKQKANVYRYKLRDATTDVVAKDIINGIEGNTESVTQENDESDGTVAIVTKREYCLIYHPENEHDTVYVQISKRLYNYTSDNAPYRSSSATTNWYRRHYYSSSFTKDSSSYKRTASPYSMYKGDTIHNIGNGYFDSYSNSIRQSSIRARKSSEGGLGGGK